MQFQTEKSPLTMDFHTYLFKCYFCRISVVFLKLLDKSDVYCVYPQSMYSPVFNKNAKKSLLPL